ncbi:hypothetical protein HaLaN_14404 [Haematococcus lacustris]|uniref:Uncharacterized protein n=1 Tax=Haematococcus lacustris TaxID=44745 RepID=A0A699ZF23_HAELA|nr:hypothetical protein HaLaN_14404 [Haematococcus lacustris]
MDTEQKPHGYCAVATWILRSSHMDTEQKPHGYCAVALATEQVTMDTAQVTLLICVSVLPVPSPVPAPVPAPVPSPVPSRVTAPIVDN